MIEFKVLAMKAETNDMYTIFLKKNVRTNIIKTILGYSPITVSNQRKTRLWDRIRDYLWRKKSTHKH